MPRRKRMLFRERQRGFPSSDGRLSLNRAMHGLPWPVVEIPPPRAVEGDVPRLRDKLRLETASCEFLAFHPPPRDPQRNDGYTSHEGLGKGQELRSEEVEPNYEHR